MFGLHLPFPIWQMPAMWSYSNAHGLTYKFHCSAPPQFGCPESCEADGHSTSQGRCMYWHWGGVPWSSSCLCDANGRPTFSFCWTGVVTWLSWILLWKTWVHRQFVVLRSKACAQCERMGNPKIPPFFPSHLQEATGTAVFQLCQNQMLFWANNISLSDVSLRVY